ncbi:MAG: hypothetical protein MI747_13280 [Desulfobacterales bacterium]|nr:hypothetical protein [Desulfobacterales bacterium]
MANNNGDADTECHVQIDFEIAGFFHQLFLGRVRCWCYFQMGPVFSGRKIRRFSYHKAKGLPFLGPYDHPTGGVSNHFFDVLFPFRWIFYFRQIAVLIHSHGNEVNAVPIGMGVGVDDFNCGRALSVFENNTGGAEHDTLCLGLGYAKSHGKDDGANER